MWAGFDQPRDMGEGETGGRISAPIFRDFMREALRDTSPTPFRIPAGARLVRIDAMTGALPNAIDDADDPRSVPPRHGADARRNVFAVRVRRHRSDRSARAVRARRRRHAERGDRRAAPQQQQQQDEDLGGLYYFTPKGLANSASFALVRATRWSGRKESFGLGLWPYHSRAAEHRSRSHRDVASS